ncbi:MAG: FG-GAP-like repeat-containing protein, partial [Prochloraceae cyanobacterium]|nr:FG-GAP-like repeat-containing protein [Prochloraceae cyanobacterium]
MATSYLKLGYLSPDANSHTFPFNNNILVDFYGTQVLDSSTATSKTLVIHGMQTGQLESTFSVETIDTSGSKVSINPTKAFKPGELIQVTITPELLTSSGSTALAEPYVYQFRAGVNAGHGYFSDSGQALGDGSFDVELGDLDGDGDLDAIDVDYSGLKTVWLNDGSGNFTDSGQDFFSFYNSFYSTNIVSDDVELGDLDGDGDLDVMVANYIDSPSSRDFNIDYLDLGNEVWLNDGSGNFTESRQRFRGLFNTQDVELGDLDGDGDLDAIVASGSTLALDKVRYQVNTVWLNDGLGNFTDGIGNFTDSGQALGTSKSFDVELGDLDGDGDLDAFFANYIQANTVWLNDGSGNFTDSGQALGSSYSLDVELGDLDGDGDLDAMVANNSKANTVWLNDGNGNFTNSGQALGSSWSYGVE